MFSNLAAFSSFFFFLAELVLLLDMVDILELSSSTIILSSPSSIYSRFHKIILLFKLFIIFSLYIHDFIKSSFYYALHHLFIIYS